MNKSSSRQENCSDASGDTSSEPLLPQAFITLAFVIIAPLMLHGDNGMVSASGCVAVRGTRSDEMRHHYR
jgi:hypothetical protein